MALLLSRLGAFSARHRRAVVLVWLVVLVGGGVGAATLAGETSSTFSIPGQESTTALRLIEQDFGAGGDGATARVVVQSPDGSPLTGGTNAAAVQGLVTELGGLPGVVSASDPLDPAAPAVNADRTTAYSTVTYDAAVGGVTVAEQDALVAAVDDARGSSGLTVEIGGDALNETPSVAGIGELAGVVVALLVLAITYGTLVTAGMNLLTAVIGVGTGVLGITIATGFLDLSSTTSALAGMLGLAVGIDYGLFIVSRFRQELRRGSDVGTAVATAVGTAGSAVVTAGLTVVIALVGLAVVGIPFLTQMGIAAAGTIVVAVLVALTLVPAVLGLLGRRTLPRRDRTAPGVTHHAAARDGFLAGWVAAVTRRRVLSLLLAAVALGAIAVPFFSMRTTLVQTQPEGSTQARAEQLLADGFGEGFNGPLTVLFQSAGAAEAATAASGAIGDLADVTAVAPAIPNADDSAALLTVIPESGPTSQATEQLVADLRDQLADLDGVDAYVTGSTAVSVDVSESLDAALPVYLVLVVGLALVLLVLVFRSLLVPLVGVLGFLLTIGASLGATVAVFQWGWLSDLLGIPSTGPLISLTPILVIGILFGLAMDYQIFLVSRMHEAHSSGASAMDAIRTGFRQAAPVVVAAALIMFAVFAGFFTGDEATIKSIAFALASGILFDAFVVRMVLVPAALALLGERAWWLPRWLRWLPQLDVEGAALEQGTPARTSEDPVPVG
ncbi:MMPL family transporter [Modestobacter excelsi]|uniref:MMPL family transporter n=1 Tax=Modestobacter excelsi TaxID=2213161 RepID=UPI00110C8DBE|nr:MMPL family transporter [Modestobacter excelsi]